MPGTVLILTELLVRDAKGRKRHVWLEAPRVEVLLELAVLPDRLFDSILSLAAFAPPSVVLIAPDEQAALHSVRAALRHWRESEGRLHGDE